MQVNDKIKKVFVVYNYKKFTIVKLPFHILKILDYTLVLEQGFLTRGARNVPKGCGDAESLKLIRPTLLNTKKRYVTDFKFTSGK